MSSNPRSDTLDFSSLFKLDALAHLDVTAYSFYEVGLKKFLVLSSEKKLIFIYIDPQSEQSDLSFDWDNQPIHCICFEPSGTWALCVTEGETYLLPFLPLFWPGNTFDQKWSHTERTVLSIPNLCKPTTVVWWLTKESDNILIIGSKIGIITFYSLETQSVVGESKVSDEIKDLQICFDDSLDLLTLLITGIKLQQWKLVLEHRSFGYNWLHQQTKADFSRRDGFMSYIKQLSKDKITLFTQGSSKDNKQSVEYVLKPTEYLPNFRKGSNNWALTSQYVNGRHFLTALETNEGTLILESPEQDVPSRTLRPIIPKDAGYEQGLWSPRVIYLAKKSVIEVHSSSFSVIQGDGLLGIREQTLLWSAELPGHIMHIYTVWPRQQPAAGGGWREPTFMCDLQLPRLALHQCLVVTTEGAYKLTTLSDPSEWLVSMIMRGGAGAEQSAAALGAPVPLLLAAAADMLLARGKPQPAQYLYQLSKCNRDGWAARLGVFGRLQELANYKQCAGAECALGNAAVTIKLLASLLKTANNVEEKFDTTVKLTELTSVELEELCSVAAAIGLWDLVPTFSVHRGNPSVLLKAMESRSKLCRGAFNCLLRQRSVVPLLLEEDGQWLLEFITENCKSFDLKILKTPRMQELISTFMHVACAAASHMPTTELNAEVSEHTETWTNQFQPRRALSCGLAHWAVVDDGSAKIMLADTPIDTDLIGRVISVACGRHHTLVLTENGIYSAGDNSYGQLGVGSAWAGGVGDTASAHGALRAVPGAWRRVAAAAAGHYHSAAVDQGGLLYTWGWGVHGQLGLGTIDDEWTPQLVTRLQGRKVLQVGCGACHTAVLVMNGSVFGFGASVFGQLGLGRRDKSCVPLPVTLPDGVASIAVGYFHNLALTSKGQLYVWGGSPQNIRAANARRSPPADSSPCDPHLLPRLVDTSNVQGTIVQMSAGWHHSCIINNAGTLYSWGLNFDGQLGMGDRKLVHDPTEVRMAKDTPVDSEPSKNRSSPSNNKAESAKTPDADIGDKQTKALVSCGGDFTIYIDDEGRVFAAGNSHIEIKKEPSKLQDRVIMMKTTKRVIKIPASRSNNKFLCFSPIDRVDIMFPFNLDNMHRAPIKPLQNPLTSLADFKRNSWPDEIIHALQPWIKEESLTNNYNMAAKLAYINKKYSDCLKYLLDNLIKAPQANDLYLAHTQLDVDSKEESMKRDERKIAVTNVMSKRIKEISLAILNEQEFPVITPATYKQLPCCCDEVKCLPMKPVDTPTDNNDADKDVSIEAAEIIDKCMNLFPVDSVLWEFCFRYAKNFYLENNLSITELESVLQKCMKRNVSAMAAAIMYSDDCAQYDKILSPKFFLNMSSEIMDTWG
ncbi:hypothetical protein JYU34_016746 [Plutella xylostella]|uniref:Uncharacterized protein n=1 Tax=Plutella xylostella TaxID=51655 RepID=A0ABQ7Q3E1_PLUXY|nr:hypothetical protein JYU34_016746 [Plutella xylostella]